MGKRQSEVGEREDIQRESVVLNSEALTKTIFQMVNDENYRVRRAVQKHPNYTLERVIEGFVEDEE